MLRLTVKLQKGPHEIDPDGVSILRDDVTWYTDEANNRNTDGLGLCDEWMKRVFPELRERPSGTVAIFVLLDEEAVKTEKMYAAMTSIKMNWSGGEWWLEGYRYHPITSSDEQNLTDMVEKERGAAIRAGEEFVVALVSIEMP
jgi:hypothetical protein